MRLFMILVACLLATPIIAVAEKSSNKKDPVAVSKVKSKKQANKAPWSPVAFSVIDGRLPKNYNGLDAKKFYKLFEERIKSVKKGEFETTEEYNKRSADIKTILAPISTLDLYAFKLDTYSIYNADTQKFNIQTGYRSLCEGKINRNEDNWVTCKIAEVDYENSKYIGSNAYGGSIKIDKTQGIDFALAFPKGSQFLNELFSIESGHRRFERDKYREISEYKFRGTISVPTEKAKTLKGLDIAVLFVGNVTDAKTITNVIESTEPTFDSPYEKFIYHEAVPFELKKIIYYVVQTGEILEDKPF